MPIEPVISTDDFIYPPRDDAPAAAWATWAANLLQRASEEDHLDKQVSSLGYFSEVAVKIGHTQAALGVVSILAQLREGA